MANRGWNMWLQKSFLCIEVKKSLSFLFNLSKHVPYNFMGSIVSLVSCWIEPFFLFYTFLAFDSVRKGMPGCHFSSVGERVTIFHMARVQWSRFESDLQLLAACCPPLFLPTFLSILTAQISSKGIKMPPPTKYTPKHVWPEWVTSQWLHVKKLPKLQIWCKTIYR